jgi:hypothetical protein
MKIAYEARDTGRRFSKTSFNELFGKYVGNSGVPVDKFVFVSSSGFTRGALQRAVAEKVELLTIEQALGKNWADTKSRMQGFASANLVSFAMGPKWEGVEFGPVYERGRLECAKGHDHGTPIEYAQERFDRWWSASLLRFPKFAGNEPGERVFDKPVPIGLRGWKLRFDGRELPVQVMVLQARIHHKQELAEHRTYERHSTTDGTKEIHHIKGGQSEMIFTVGPPISVVHPPGTSLDPMHRLTPAELAEAMQSAFPDGMTLKAFEHLPPVTIKFTKPPEPKDDSGSTPPTVT